MNTAVNSASDCFYAHVDSVLYCLFACLSPVCDISYVHVFEISFKSDFTVLFQFVHFYHF